MSDQTQEIIQLRQSVDALTASNNERMSTIEARVQAGVSSATNSIVTQVQGDVAKVDSAAAKFQTDSQTVIQNAQASARTTLTWGVLSGLTPTAIGQGAEVIDSDTGTHTDPSTSVVVPNSGRYTAYALTQGAWTRISETGLSQKVSFSDGIALTSGRTIVNIGGMGVLSHDGNGRAILDLAPSAIRRLFLSDTSQEFLSVLSAFRSGKTPGRYSYDGVMLWGLNPSGEFDAVKPSARFSQMVGAQLGSLTSYDPVTAKQITSKDLSFVGDSMSPSTLTNAVGTLSGRSVITQQTGGFTASDMLYVVGISPITVTVTNNTVPADGTATPVTAKSFNILMNGGTPSGTARVYFESSGLQNVCLLETDASGNWTIKREQAGAALTVAPGSVAILHPTLGTSRIAATQTPRSRVRFIRLGRNGDMSTHAARMVTRDAILRIINYADVRQQSTLVVSVYNQRASLEPNGSAGYDNVMALNWLIENTVGKQIWVDMRTAAVRTAVYELGDTPTTADLADMAADCIPTRYFTDSTHVTDAFRLNFEAPYLNRIITARGL